jgi:hypothetical protein
MDGIEIFNSGKPIKLTDEQRPRLAPGYNGLLSYVAYHALPAPVIFELAPAQALARAGEAR